MTANDKAADLADAGSATGIVWAYRFNADGSAERTRQPRDLAASGDCRQTLPRLDRAARAYVRDGA